MRKTSFFLSVAFRVLFFLLLFFPACLMAQQKDSGKPGPQKEIIITDDVMMLDAPLRGGERLACCPYPSGRSIDIGANQSARIAWKEAKTPAGDTLQLIRLEIRKAGVVVAGLTLSLRSGAKPAVMQCMKGFGCESTWEAYPWKSKTGNFLEHPTHRFRIIPDGTTHFRIQNLDEKTALNVLVNPCAKPVKTQVPARKRN